MNPNDTNFIRDDFEMLGFAAVEKASAQEVRFNERVQQFEQCCTPGSAGTINFLRLAAADLFRTMPIVERDAVEELLAFENRFEHKCPALRQYERTLQVLRRTLEASVALETQPSAMTFQSQNTNRKQS